MAFFCQKCFSAATAVVKKRKGSQGAQDGSYCGMGWDTISGKRHYLCSPYSSISKQLLFLKSPSSSSLNVLMFHYLSWDRQPRVRMLLCAVALQNSGLLGMLRMIDLVLKESI